MTPQPDDRLERTVQLTGGSTYTVSLPKQWAQGQQIEPGVAVALHPRGERLVVTSSETDELRRVTIDAADHDADTLARAVGAAYVGGADEIVLEGPGDTGQRRAATQAVRRFVGLEVLAEDEGGLTARTMLDSPELPPERAIDQTRRTTLEMHREAVAAVVAADGSRATRVDAEDDTVDRLFALVSREFQRSLVDPETPIRRDDGLSSFEYYAMARQLERVADHAEKVAAIAGELETAPDAEIAAEIEAHGEAARAIVADALDGLLPGEPETDLVAVIETAEDVLAEIEGLDERLYRSEVTEGYRLGVVLDSLVRTVEYGVNIAEAGLRAGYREES